MDTQVKTKSITNTQIAVAVAVAVLAGGLAFAASPRNKRAPACTVASVEFVNSCPKGGKYHTANFVCSDGSTGKVVGNTCRTTSKLQQAIERACSRKKCVAGAPIAPVIPVAPVAPAVQVAPIVPLVADDPNQCGLTHINYFNSCGKNKFQILQFTCSDGYSSEDSVSCSSVSDLQNRATAACGKRDCQVLPPQSGSASGSAGTNESTDTSVSTGTGGSATDGSATDQPQGDWLQNSVGAPIVYISGNDLSFRKDEEKVAIGVRLANRGKGNAGTEVKYTLYFLDDQKLVVQMLDLNLSSTLKARSEKLFTTVLPLPEGARFVQVVVDPNFSDGEDIQVTSVIPAEFLPQ